ncbi:acyl-CoA desaturase [Sulfurimonas sp.]|jgi:fatty acid desaturase|uniref:acyl-CoA desaturase n=1 Tax=Sulfurimonas sp. TaxID=2022749 RepID=UPI0025E56538|nr:acyl-CoA desaturase [Sulfurimonas sp.]MBT5935080.1 acyl-CoA desaturase [Sulfurimonas sp.]
MSTTTYPDNFNELKAQVKEAGLLQRVPVRGSLEMLAILLSMGVVYYLVSIWSTIEIDSLYKSLGLGLFMTVIFTRAVYVSHDLLHLQYFKSKSLSMKLSYPFSAFILSNSSSWWDFKHNVNHHTWCNVLEKDEDIWALDGAFTPNNKGNSPFLKKYKHIVFWGALFFMYGAFIVQSYNFAIKRKLWGEVALMLVHWPLVWGTIFYFLPLADALIVFATLYFTLSPWLAFGFITNHLGCEVFDYEEGKEFSWMELQMRTSRSLKGGMLTHWFYGGLNTQIEHHLFPRAPRFNLLKVQKMTKDFAKKHNMQYFEMTPVQAYVQINNVLAKY